MIARLSLIALSAVLLASPVASKEKTKTKAVANTVACAGVYGPDSSEALLKETFGAENVVTGMVYGAEGMEMLATTVFPDDPEKKMQFGWFDDESLTRLAYVELARGQVGPGGIAVGMSIADVVKANGAEFEVNGFWWDYGGYAYIETGALAGTFDGGCTIALRFAPLEEELEGIDITSIGGDTQVSSSEPLLETVDVRLQVLTLHHPWPEDLDTPEY